tara:strand:+ start:388 stop:693 length:306 start_codon:yes stop_codon:yes gene_type:complete
MRNVILIAGLAGSLFFATPAYGQTPNGYETVIDTPQKTIIINMINFETTTEKKDRGYTVKGYGKTWKAFIPNSDAPSSHAQDGFEKPRNSDESFKFQKCGE